MIDDSVIFETFFEKKIIRIFNPKKIEYLDININFRINFIQNILQKKRYNSP